MNVALDRDRERSLGAMCEALRATNQLVQDESKIGAVATPVETMDYYPFGSPNSTPLQAATTGRLGNSSANLQIRLDSVT
jgi:hypothetical protein